MSKPIEYEHTTTHLVTEEERWVVHFELPDGLYTTDPSELPRGVFAALLRSALEVLSDEERASLVRQLAEYDPKLSETQVCTPGGYRTLSKILTSEQELAIKVKNQRQAIADLERKRKTERRFGAAARLGGCIDQLSQAMGEQQDYSNADDEWERLLMRVQELRSRAEAAESELVRVLHQRSQEHGRAEAAEEERDALRDRSDAKLLALHRILDAAGIQQQCKTLEARLESLVTCRDHQRAQFVAAESRAEAAEKERNALRERVAERSRSTRDDPTGQGE